MLRVAIDSGPLTSGHAIRGIGVNTKELIDYLKKEVQGSKKIEIDSLDFLNVSENTLASYDVVHYTSFHPFFRSLPFRKLGKKVVLTIHDLIPLIYPKHYVPGFKGAVRYWINRLLIRKNVDSILTISETSKKDICRFLKVNPDKVHVSYLAPKDIFKTKIDKLKIKKVIAKYNLPKEYILYVGDVNYNKNIPTLVKASIVARKSLVIVGKQAKEVDSDLNLNVLNGVMDYVRYLLGKPHPEVAHYKQLERLFKQNNVKRLGFVSDEELVYLYKLAKVYVQPSLYEGFGLPALEAYTAGTSVCAARTQALVEILGDGASYFPPLDDKKLARTINNPQVGGDLPRKYSWKTCAQKILALYEGIS